MKDLSVEEQVGDSNPGASASATDVRIAELRAEREALLPALSRSPTSWWQSSGANPMTVGVTVLAFGLLVMLLAAYLVKTGRQPQAVLRLVGTLAIITLAMFLVVIGYSDRQITLVMGLLGTVVGYLLGKETPPSHGNG